MRALLRAIVAAAGLSCVIGAPPPVFGSAVVDVPVRFEVTLQNRSRVPCAGTTGSGPATVAGRLVAPRSLAHASVRSITLYLHGLGFGQWFWSFDAVPGLDYARALAAEGHASLIVDRIGYGASTHPDGNQSCVGLQADVAHQIVEQLRAGSYAVEGRFRPLAFDHVALAGHSAGGAIAQIEAYSFADVDGLVVASYADQGASPDALATFSQAGVTCASGMAPGNYVSFGATDADFDHVMFNTPRPSTGQLPLLDSGPTAAPDVIAATNEMRSPDPCGDDASISLEIVASEILLPGVTVPVLVVCGEEDALFPPPACDLQALHFSGSRDVTEKTIPGAGHAVTLGFAAEDFRAEVASWLAARGF